MKLNLVLLACSFLIWSCDNQSDKIESSKVEILEVNSNSENPYFIHLSDIHLDTEADSITYGHDTDTRLWDSTKVKLQSVLSRQPAPDFILYTGDLSGHYSCWDSTSCFIPKTKRGPHNTNIATLLNDFRKLTGDKKIPFLYLPGNNDALAGDYFSFSDASQKTPLDLSSNSENPFPALNTASNCGEPPCIISQVNEKMGYYSVHITQGLRIIALNSIILGRDYFQRDGTEQVKAGNEQMKWLEEELQKTEKAGQKAYLAMHIPPGLDAYSVSKGKPESNTWAHLPSPENSWLNSFLSMTETYKNSITGIFYGHTHMEELRRLYGPNSSEIAEIAISAPGITPQHYNNPGFKTVSYDKKSKEIIDFTTYYTTPLPGEWASYQFSNIFDCDKSENIYDCLNNMPLTEVNRNMDRIFTVMHGLPSYDTKPGIEVKIGQ